MMSDEIASGTQDPNIGSSSGTSEGDFFPMYDGEFEINSLIKCFLDVPDLVALRSQIQISKLNQMDVNKMETALSCFDALVKKLDTRG